MQSTKLIFGYGSLLSRDSLRATVPNVGDITPAYIKGFVRDFSLWDPEGFTETNLDVGGIAFCALDVKEVKEDLKVNGVIFEVSEDYLSQLKTREKEYKLIKTGYYDFSSKKYIGECYVFSANKNNGTYVKNLPAQERYLQVCLEGAKEYGTDFYQDFCRTTFIKNETLTDYLSRVQN